MGMPGYNAWTLGGIIDLPESGSSDESEDNGMENGVNSSLLNVAGYWTVGIVKGVSIVAVPILFVSLTAGLVMKVIEVSQTIGGK